MQLCKRSVLLLLLVSWLSILVSARAIPSASQEECAEDNCPVTSQGSSLVGEGRPEQISNVAHLSHSTNALSIIPSTFRRETVVEVEKRKSPSSPNTNSPNTNSGNPDPNNGSNNGDGTNTGGGLDLNNPGGNDPSPAPKDPGAGLDLNSPVTKDPSPTTPDPSVATQDAPKAASSVSPVSSVTAASSPAAAPTATPGNPSGDKNAPGSPNPTIIKDDQEAADKFCSSTPGGLRLRGICGSKQAGDDGADSETPARIRQDPNPLPPAVAPAVDRQTVTNWYDVIEQNPKPLFRAEVALAVRFSGRGQDRPIADLGEKYSLFDESKADILAQDGMGSIQTMWQTLQRPSPGGAQRTWISGVMKPEQRKNPNQEDPVVYEATFADDGSFIGALSSYRNQDPLVGTEDRIEWSELMFSQLNRISGGNPSALSTVVRASIVRGHATDTTINAALAKTGKTTAGPTEIATFRADADAGTPEALAFEAISRSDNVNGVLFLLADHFDAIGRKRITHIHVARSSDDDSYNIILDIGR